MPPLIRRAGVNDPESYISRAGMQFNTFFFEPGQEISAQLGAVDVAADEIDLIVNSHLHYDHAGGNALLPNADVLVQEREWEHARTRPDDDIAYRKIDFDTGQQIRLVSGEYDLFADGSVVAIPTAGHTPGHQSLRVQTERGLVVLCADACYLRSSIDKDHVPAVLYDREAVLRSFALLRKLEAAGARILLGHDPDFWKTIPRAPLQLA